MASGSWEDYVYPGTQVLKNKPDIRDQAELQRFERRATAFRIQALQDHPVKGDFDLCQEQIEMSGFVANEMSAFPSAWESGEGRSP